ncbi:MAG: NAD-dependent epimerase/dehydratase family protein [Bacteroidia bacterium]|nr:NAD-dependent epimerase/dehydratase family protein [Bacteroidia bacterium]
MKIIITGAAGFIGSNLTKKLLADHHEVIGIDNFSYGNRYNISPFSENKLYSFIEADLVDPSVLKNLHADIIVHLASQKIPRYTNAYKTLEENGVLLKNIIKKCLDDKIKLVFASTSDVYGKNKDIPFHEGSDLVMGATTVKRWAYALSKMYAEQFIIATNEEFGLEYTIMRFFGSYGPNQNTTWWGGPQSVFIQNILEGKTLEIHGDGLQTRTFTYVDDTVQGIMKCMFHPASKNEIFNIASEPDEEVTIKDLAETIWRLMKGGDQKTDLKLIPYSTFGNYEDVRRRVPSIDKIKKMLGYIPAFHLEKGLEEAIRWQKEFNELTKKGIIETGK